MKRAQWRNHVGLPFLLLTAMLSTSVTPAALSAGLRLAAPPVLDCQTVTPASAARGALAAPAEPGALRRVEPRLGKRGELYGRVINARTVEGKAVSIALPVESFVAPAVGELLVYTRYSAATGSEVRALSLVSGCDIRLAAPTEIVRSAVLDRSATHLYAHSVSRAGRADAGITRYDLATGTAVHVLAPVKPPKDFGPIFGTDLRWNIAGDALAVQTCGFSRCLTRVLEIATSNVASYEAAGQGAFIGLTEGHLISFGQCPGLPCAAQSTDLRTGGVSVLAAEAFSAQLKPSGTGSAVVSIETSAGVVEVVQ